MDDAGPLIYLYTDTRWQNINVVPALRLGRIDRMLILTARRGGDFRLVDDTNAERAHNGFIAGYDHEVGRREQRTPVRANVLEGPLIGLTGWRTAIYEELLELPQQSTIVFNYLSGPTDVKIGAWLALDDLRAARPDISVRRVLYDAPSRLEWHEADGREWIERIGHVLSLEGWLLLHGFTEPVERTNQRRIRERDALTWKDETYRLADLVFRHPGMPPGWYAQISGSITSGATVDLVSLMNNDSTTVNVRRDIKRRALQELEAVINRLGERFDCRHPLQLRSFSTTPDFSAYLRSGWFEEVVYLTMVERLRGGTASTDEPAVALGLHLHPDDETNAANSRRHSNPYEIDVAVIANNQLHAIECKACKNPIKSKTKQEWVDRARSSREAVIGPGGMSAIASVTGIPDYAGIRAWAKLGQIDVLGGWREISEYIGKVAARCRQ